MLKLQEKETDQETFDFVVEKLMEQGFPSMKGGLCVYGEPGGARCAIGHLMGDQECNRQRTIYEMIQDGLVSAPRSLLLMDALQKAHDRAAMSAVHSLLWAKRCANNLINAAEDLDINPSKAQEWFDHVQNQ
jgi:hypothetical protein